MKFDPYNFELYRFKVCAFFLRQCIFHHRFWQTKCKYHHDFNLGLNYHLIQKKTIQRSESVALTSSSYKHLHIQNKHQTLRSSYKQ